MKYKITDIKSGRKIVRTKESLENTWFTNKSGFSTDALTSMLYDMIAGIIKVEVIQ